LAVGPRFSGRCHYAGVAAVEMLKLVVTVRALAGKEKILGIATLIWCKLLNH